MSSVVDSSSRLFWLIVLSAIFPPIAVAVEFGFCWDLLWSVLLTLLIPFGGFVHAVYLLCRERYSNVNRSQYSAIDSEADIPNSSTHGETLVAEIFEANSEAQNNAPLNNVDPPPYASTGSNVAFDNKVQRNF